MIKLIGCTLQVAQQQVKFPYILVVGCIPVAAMIQLTFYA